MSHKGTKLVRWLLRWGSIVVWSGLGARETLSCPSPAHHQHPPTPAHREQSIWRLRVRHKPMVAHRSTRLGCCGHGFALWLHFLIYKLGMMQTNTPRPQDMLWNILGGGANSGSDRCQGRVFLWTARNKSGELSRLIWLESCLTLVRRGGRGGPGHTITCPLQLEDARALGSELPASWCWALGRDCVACN